MRLMDAWPSQPLPDHVNGKHSISMIRNHPGIPFNGRNFLDYSISVDIFFLNMESDNFAENLRKFPGIFPGNMQKFSGIFQRKIGRKCQQLYQGISCNQFRGTRSEEFLVTHSKEILITLSKEFLVTNSREFLVTNSAEKLEKMSTKFVEILFPRFFQEYLEIFSAYS